MIRKILSIFFNSLAESQKLQARYRATTNRLGWLSVIIGCVVLISLMYQSWVAFGFPLQGGPMQDGDRIKLLLWVVLIVVITPIGFYLGMLVVNAAYGLLMFTLGKFTWQQMIDFSCSAKYPAAWYS